MTAIATVAMSYGSGISVDIETDHAVPSAPEHRFTHLDGLPHGQTAEHGHIHAFVYDDEDRTDELADRIEQLQGQFIFVTGVVFPSWLREEMPLDQETLKGVEWLLALEGGIEPEQLEIIREHAEEDHEPE